MKRKMKFIRRSFFLFALLLVMAAMTACCSDEEDRFKVQFHLEDENGVPKTGFNQGENIIFKLTIYNNSDERYSVDFISLFDDNLFRVYSTDGKDYGTSWEAPYFLERMEYILAHDSRMFSCPWLNDEKLIPTYPLVMKEDMQPLPVGDYYTKFDLKFNENNVIHCKQNFKIK